MLRKYTVLAAAIIIQICLGGIYAWSTFVSVLISDYGLTSTQTQLIFGITIAIFTIAMTFAGQIQVKHGPRLIGSIGGIFFFAGYLIASFSNGNFPILLLGISVISGIGIGFGYICPLATSVKWFPNHKGLVTGLAVAGFGGGGVLLSRVGAFFLHQDISVLTIFGGIGLIYGVTIFLSSQLLSLPHNIHSNTNRPIRYDITELINTKYFWRLSIGIFAGTFAGLLVIGNLTAIGLAFNVNQQEALLAISTFAIGNAAGRISWGWLYDRIGYNSVFLCLFTLAISIIALVPASNFATMFMLIAAMVGFGFGGCFVLFAAQVGTHFGINAVGQVYPFVFLFYGLAGILGPVAGGWLFEITNSYLTPVIIATTMALIGALVMKKEWTKLIFMHLFA